MGLSILALPFSNFLEFSVIREYENISRREFCDLSVCTATTRKVNPAELQINGTRRTTIIKPKWRSLYGGINASGAGLMRKEFSMMDLNEEDETYESITPSFGGVTLGIAQILDAERRSDISTERKRNRSLRNSWHSLEKIETASTGPESIEEKKSSGLSYSISNDSEVEVFVHPNSSLGGTPFLSQKESMFLYIGSECARDEPEITKHCDIPNESKCLSSSIREELELKSLIPDKEALFSEDQSTTNIKGKIRSKYGEELDEKYIYHSEAQEALPKKQGACVESFESCSEMLRSQIDKAPNDEGYDQFDLAHLDESCWMELDASSFAVRGSTYLRDKRKVASGGNILRLITVDFLQVSEPLFSGVCLHPGERVSFCHLRP